jgi:hypothetical protein
LAHSLHGRLRRIHVPHTAVYAAFALAIVGAVSAFGMVSSYLRMSWKVSHYNSLRKEVDSLRARYRELQQVTNQKNQQLASLETFASEVSVAFGLRHNAASSSDLTLDMPLTPNFRESLGEYNFLQSASLSSTYAPPCGRCKDGW